MQPEELQQQWKEQGEETTTTVVKANLLFTGVNRGWREKTDPSSQLAYEAE